MEKKVVRGVTIFLLILTICVSFVLLNYPDLHVFALQKRVEYAAKVKTGYSVLDLMRDETEVLAQSSQGEDAQKQLRLEVPENVKLDQVKVTNQPVYQTVEIEIPKIEKSYFYDYPMIGSSDHISDITFDVEGDKGVIDIVLDSVYELDIQKKGHYMYLDFVNPRDIYDYIVVVDAGHGGNAPGATKQGITEKDIDLDIVKKLKKKLDDSDKKIGVYYTRLDDTNPSLESRVTLANDLSADLFLSVHNNSTASGRMSGINGTEVMYRVSDKSGKSKEFAEVCLNSLLQTLGSQDKGVVAGDDIYIIRTSQVPVALVEVGFMTNQEELDKLNSSEYQEQCAQALYDSILQMLDNLKQE